MLTLAAFAACEPDAEGDLFDGRVCLEVEHHGVPVSDITIYRALGEDFPGFWGDLEVEYDETVELSVRNRVCLDGLALGSHWFAAVGYDPALDDVVRGSLRLDVNVLSNNLDTVLKVSEQH